MSDDLTIETEDFATVELTPPRDGVCNLIVDVPGEETCEVRVKYADLQDLLWRAERRAER